MNTDAKLAEVIERVVSRYIIGFAIPDLTTKHQFQPHANPKHLADAMVKEIKENLAYGTVVPQFDAMVPQQEALAIELCQEISGLKGKKGSPPDPVRLLEMAEALYKAEVNAS